MRCDGKNREGRRRGEATSDREKMEGRRRGEATSDREKRGLRRTAMKRVRTVRCSTVRT